MRPAYGEQKNFMDKFFSLNGLQIYYEQRALVTDLAEHKFAAQVLAQPCDNYMIDLMHFYKCDPSWPICVFDFTHRNRNPKFLTLRVEQPLTSLIKDNYFSKQLLN